MNELADFGEITLGDQDVTAEQPKPPRPHGIGFWSGLRDALLGQRLRLRQLATQEREVGGIKRPLKIGFRKTAVAARHNEQQDEHNSGSPAPRAGTKNQEPQEF